MTRHTARLYRFLTQIVVAALLLGPLSMPARAAPAPDLEPEQGSGSGIALSISDEAQKQGTWLWEDTQEDDWLRVQGDTTRQMPTEQTLRATTNGSDVPVQASTDPNSDSGGGSDRYLMVGTEWMPPTVRVEPAPSLQSSPVVTYYFDDTAHEVTIVKQERVWAIRGCFYDWTEADAKVVVFRTELQVDSGTCTLKAMGKYEAQCDYGTQLWDNTSYSLGDDGYYCVGKYDSESICDIVAPDATWLSWGSEQDAGQWVCGGFQLYGLECYGTAVVYDAQLVYYGTPPYPSDMALSPNECPVCHNGETHSFPGGPINTYSGNYNYETMDLSIPTLGQPLRFERAYNSLPVTGSVVYSRPLGYGWTHNYDIRLTFPDDPGGEDSTIILKAPHGSRMRFTDQDEDGEYDPYPGVWADLERAEVTTGTFVYTVTTGNQTTFVFTDTGKLTEQVDAKGNRTAYSYTDGITLSRVTGPSGQRWLDLDYDDAGRLTSVTDHTSRTVSYGYDANDNLTTVTDTLDQVWTYTYSDTHLLHEVADPDDNVLERTFYDESGRAIRQEDGLDEPVVEIEYLLNGQRVVSDTGKVMTDTYDARHVLVGQTDAVSNSQDYAFDDWYNRSVVTDANEYATSYERTPFGYTTAVTDALTHTTRMAYDGWNNLTAITDTLTRTTTYEYEVVTRTVNGLVITLTNLITVTDPDLETTVYAYNERGQVTSVTDARDNTTTYGYDAYGQREAITDTEGTVTTFGYDAVGRLVTTTVAAGTALERVTVNTYDDGDNLTQVVRGFVDGVHDPTRPDEDVVTEYGYDVAGRQTLVTDTLGYVTRSEYDAAGRLVTHTVNYTTGVSGHGPGNEWNLTSLYGYDDAGRQVWVTDTVGQATRTWYDEVGRAISVTANYTTAGGQNYLDQYNLIAWYGYDAVGNRVWVTDTLGRETYTAYDALNRPLTRTANYEDGEYDASQPDEDLVTVTSYDEVGNVVATVDPLGRETTYEYDALGRVLTTTDALTGTTVNAYDAVGNLTSVTDTEGRETTYEYDALGRVLTTTNELDGTTVFAYDALGQRTQVTDAEGNSTTYAYDAAGRPVTVTDEMDGTTISAYDALGRRTSVTDARSNTTAYGYDALGRTIVVTDALTGTTRYVYDVLGRRTAITDAAGVAVYSVYDALGRVIETSDELENTTSYGYDALGNRTVITDARGTVTTYGYDARSRLIAVTENDTGGAGDYQTNVTTQYAYDGVGNRTVVTDANNYATTYVYDDLNRLTSVTDPLTHTTAYAYDGVGNRTVVTDAKSQAITYTYDALNRVTDVVYPDATVAYAYDDVGNRTTMTDATGTTTWAYDDLYRPLTISAPATGTLGYSYDAVGNRTRLVYPTPSTGSGQAGQVVTYTYDEVNRLQEVEDWAGETTTYGYDGAGRLVTTTLPNGVQTTYEYDDGGRLVEIEHTLDATLLARYEYTLDDAGNRTGATETLRRPVDEVASLLLAVARAEDAARLPGVTVPTPSTTTTELVDDVPLETTPVVARSMPEFADRWDTHGPTAVSRSDPEPTVVYPDTYAVASAYPLSFAGTQALTRTTATTVTETVSPTTDETRPAIEPSGPPAKIRLAARPGKEKEGGQPLFWLAAYVVDAEGQPVADGTEVQFSVRDGRLDQNAARTEGGQAIVRLLPDGVATVTATAGAARGTLQVGSAETDESSVLGDLLPTVRRARGGYGERTLARLAARNAVEVDGDRATTENVYRRVSFERDARSLAFVQKTADREAQDLALAFRLTGVSVGRESLLPERGDLRSSGNWVAYHPDGQPWQLVYEVGDETVEQFLVFEEGTPDGGDLVIEGVFDTRLEPVLISDEEGIRFESPGAERERDLAYGPAVVEDAHGRTTLARMELEGTYSSTGSEYYLRLTVPAEWLAGAAFPVVIDPLIGSAQRVSDLRGDTRRQAVASDGTDYLVVWDWGYDVYGQIVDDDGDLAGETIEISLGANSRWYPDVAYNAVAGEYLVTWLAHPYGNPYNGIWAQRVSVTGTLLGDEIQVTSLYEYLGHYDGMRVAVSEAGDYVVVWSQDDDTSDFDVYGHRCWTIRGSRRATRSRSARHPTTSSTTTWPMTTRPTCSWWPGPTSAAATSTTSMDSGWRPAAR